LLAASLALSRQVMLSLAVLITPFTFNVAGSKKRRESSEEIMAS
jgi:hypothetical protein